MPYDQLVAAFQPGDVLFGLSDDLTTAEAEIRRAYPDVADFWGKLSRYGMGTKLRHVGKMASVARRYDIKNADVFVQATLTNAVVDPSDIGDSIAAGIPVVRASRAPGGAPLTAKPAPSPVDRGKTVRKLPHEGARGLAFADFLEAHDKYDPRLMGGTMGDDGVFSPLGSREADRQWIAQSRKGAYKAHLVSEIDGGATLKLKHGREVAPRGPGQNGDLVDAHWDQIDWASYPMWEVLAGAHIKSVTNYKIWKRTSKAGLEFQTMQQQRTVHFLLDTFLKGDGMARAADKAGAHGKSITAGELRWLYRNWDKPRVQANVRFWVVTGPHAPPWETAAHRDVWAAYIPKSRAAASDSEDPPSRPLSAAFDGLI